MSKELKPCPFCGHKPHLEHDRVEQCRNSENGDIITRWSCFSKLWHKKRRRYFRISF